MRGDRRARCPGLLDCWREAPSNHSHNRRGVKQPTASTDGVAPDSLAAVAVEEHLFHGVEPDAGVVGGGWGCVGGGVGRWEVVEVRGCGRQGARGECEQPVCVMIKQPARRTYPKANVIHPYSRPTSCQWRNQGGGTKGCEQSDSYSEPAWPLAPRPAARSNCWPQTAQLHPQRRTLAGPPLTGTSRVRAHQRARVETCLVVLWIMVLASVLACTMR
jgi:hypothetical protein